MRDLKSLIPVFLTALLICGFSVASITRFSLAQNSASFKISGYILDSNGHGLAGANIIFNVPEIVPSVHSDSSGYYEIFAPAGTYRVTVWPPFDSNYIYYDEQGFVVESDITKNITLASGYKVSGYITDASGNPIVKAVVTLDKYLCGWYSNYSGYYFVTAPAGTYTLGARPANGPQNVSDFSTYYEYDVVVTGDLAKNITVGSIVSASNRTEISGYVLDANGNGLAGAEIIFCVPDIVPSVYTNDSGYYAIYAPAGNYHLIVWPPFDSNYLSYDQPAFSVGSSDIIKNVTLSSGYKLSGYLTDSTGAPIRGALASLDLFHCGWYSNNTGYYFVTAPAGTYKLMIQPKTGPTFSIYTENNFVLTYDIVRNFTLTTSESTTAPTSNPKRANPLLDISCKSSVSYSGFNVEIEGSFTLNETAISDAPILLSYSVNGGKSWQDITLVYTGSDGSYSATWLRSVAGNYLVKATYEGDVDKLAASSEIVNLAVTNFAEEGILFAVSSNSTVTSLAFNSTTSVLSFTISGPSETTGYVKATIAKSLVSNAENIKVYLDGNQLNYEVTSNADSWLFSFTYTHSTHQVSIDLAANTIGTAFLGMEYWTWIVAGTITAVISAGLLFYFKKRKQ